MRIAALATIAALAFAASAAAASPAYDRMPVTLAGLTPDGWGLSTTTAQQVLRARYPGIISDFCYGVNMAGYVSRSSSWVHGLTRYWDKLQCLGYTYSSPQAIFSLILDAKSDSGWVIYRLKGTSLTDLRIPNP